MPRILCLMTLIILGLNLAAQKVISESTATQLVESKSVEKKVLFFFIEDCPACQYMAHHLVELAASYPESEMKVVGVYIPGTGSEEDLNQFLSDFQINFPIVYDPDLDWVTRYQATVTPEVVLLDREGEVRYQGAVNNYYYRLGKHRKIVTQHYLLDAISALEEGKEITRSYAEPIGCFIE